MLQIVQLMVHNVCQSCLLSKIKNEKMISQIVGNGNNCDQNGDRVSKNHKSCHIFSMRLKRIFSKI